VGNHAMSKLPKRSGKARGRNPWRPSDLEIALLPEIAIARVGGSTEPLTCYDWSKQPDNTAGGSGKSKLESRPTLRISDKGDVEEYQPEPAIPSRAPRGQSRIKRHSVEFTEPVDNGRDQKLRPVCPWFVIFAKWRGGEWELLRPQDLKLIGADVSWHVVVANRKAYNMTLAFEDVIYAEAKIAGRGYQKKDLIGRSDDAYWEKYSGFPRRKDRGFNDRKRLIPKDARGFHLGRIEAPLFSEQYGIRLRFFAPRGAIYGPTNLKARIAELLDQLSDEERADLLNNWDNWNNLTILDDASERRRCCILNPNSAWARKRTTDKQEGRTDPGPQFAHIEVSKKGDFSGVNSLGLIDDFSDGIVTFELRVNGVATHTAQARIVVGPPDLAPDRRHPVRLYEAFQDRAYLAKTGSLPRTVDELRDECLDIFRRAYETVGLTNVDAMNNRLSTDDQYGNEFSKHMERTAPGDLPLTQWATERHRRLASSEALADFLREEPSRKGARRVILEPGSENDQHGLLNLPPSESGSDAGQVPKANTFTRMPALMRGSPIAPLHLTKRQIEVLRRWRATLKS
jgi:hypothetical protein